MRIGGEAPGAKNRIQPKDERAIADIGDQPLRLVRPTFLITKEQEYNYHRSALAGCGENPSIGRRFGV
jgi:hypothetical protein